MADTLRNAPYLQNALRDGQPTGSIVPQIVRDFVVSVMSTTVGVAAAGTTQGTATALSSTINIITTVAAGSGVILTSGVRVIVLNRGANSLLIYPPVSGQLEALGTNAPFTLQAGADATILFDPANATQGYVTTMINVSSLPTSLPSTSGVVWKNGGVLSVS